MWQVFARILPAGLDQGKTLHVKIDGRTPADDEGNCRLFFELNGQPRLVRVPKSGAASTGKGLRVAEDGNPKHVASPMPGSVARIAVKVGQKVVKGDVLASIEAMKMESLITAEHDGTVSHVHVNAGDAVSARTLLMEIG